MKKFMMMVPQSLPSPLIRKLSQLDEEMKQILERNDLGEFEKARAYSDTLDRYLAVKRKLQQPVPIPIVDSTPPHKPSALNMNILPRQYQSRGENLLSHLKTNSDLKWNNRGEILNNGEVLPGSNVIDLIDDVVRLRKKEPPIGSDVFVRGLRESNVPMALIGNKTRFHAPTPLRTPGAARKSRPRERRAPILQREPTSPEWEDY